MPPAAETSAPSCVEGSATPGPANFLSLGTEWNQVQPPSPTSSSCSASRTLGQDFVAVTCSWLILSRCQPCRYEFVGYSAAAVAPVGAPGICVNPVIRFGSPRVASATSGPAYWTGWFGRYEYSPCSATPF